MSIINSTPVRVIAIVGCDGSGKSTLTASLVNELAYNFYIYIFRFLIRNRLDFLFYFREIIFPEIIFTVVTTLLIYKLVLAVTKWLEEWEQRRDTTIV